MAFRLKVQVVLVLALLLAGQCVTSAQQGEAKLGTPITSLPYTIPAPGVYVLTQDFLNVNMANGAAITINATDVVLDLNGHTISNTAAGAATIAYGVYAANQTNVTVRNGTVQGFMTGVGILTTGASTSSYGHMVEKLNVNACTYEGISLVANDSTVRSCQVTNIGGSSLLDQLSSAYGIEFLGTGLRCLDNDVSQMTASGTDGVSYAIYLDNATDAFVLNNRMSTAQYGLYFGAASGQYRHNLVTGMLVQGYVGGTDAGKNIVDSNNDGVDDDWEMQYFGTLDVNLYAPAPNGEGMTILQAYQQGLNPVDFYTAQTPNLSIVSGTPQSAAPGSFVPAPLVVQVVDANGNPISGAPVTFSVASGGGQLQASRQASPKSTLSVKTDANGKAQAFFQVSNTAGVTSSLNAIATGTSPANPAVFQETADSNAPVNPTPTDPNNPVDPNNPQSVPVQSYACVDVSGSVQGNNDIRAVALDDSGKVAFAFSSSPAPLPGTLSTYFGVPDGNAVAYVWSNGQLGAKKETDLTARADILSGYNYDTVVAYLGGVDTNGTVYGYMFNMDLGDAVDYPGGQIGCCFSSTGGTCTPVALPFSFSVVDDSGSIGRPGYISPLGSLGFDSYGYANSKFLTTDGSAGSVDDQTFPIPCIKSNGISTVFDAYTDYSNAVLDGSCHIAPYAFSPAIVNNQGAALGASWDGSGGYTISLWTNASPPVAPIFVGAGDPAGLNDQNQAVVKSSSAEGYLWENGSQVILVNHLPAELFDQNGKAKISNIQPKAISNQTNPDSTSPGYDQTIYILATANVTQSDGTTVNGATIVCSRDNDGDWDFEQVGFPDGMIVSKCVSINSSGAIAFLSNSLSQARGEATSDETPNPDHANIGYRVKVSMVSSTLGSGWGEGGSTKNSILTGDAMHIKAEVAKVNGQNIRLVLEQDLKATATVWFIDGSYATFNRLYSP